LRDRFDRFRGDLSDEWERLQRAGQGARNLWDMVGGGEVPRMRDRVQENWGRRGEHFDNIKQSVPANVQAFLDALRTRQR